jgi:hypothetical protein
MDAHAREASAAIAGMADTYGTVWLPSPGDVVMGELPYIGGRRAGILQATNGTYCLVEMDGEVLAYYSHELEFTGRREVVA